MHAARHIGRVGGLAVALGVGTAVFTGSPAAWADGVSRDSAPSGSAQSTRNSAQPTTPSATAWRPVSLTQNRPHQTYNEIS